jgi:hypothetical protein
MNEEDHGQRAKRIIAMALKPDPVGEKVWASIKCAATPCIYCEDDHCRAYKPELTLFGAYHKCATFSRNIVSAVKRKGKDGKANRD